MRTSIIITTKDEVKLAKRAIRAILNQNIADSEVIVVSPNNELQIEGVTYLQDSGEGKYAALKQGIQASNGEIIIFTDGDVITSNLSFIINKFKDLKTGAVGGKVVPIGDSDNKYYFWANWLTDSAHFMRKNLSKRHKFFNLSGYLFAIRKELWTELEKDKAEDTTLPLNIFKKGYRLKYEPGSLVYIKSPSSLKDFISQKTRTASAHLNIKESPKSFINEATLGFTRIIRENWWLLQLFILRIYIWIKAKFRRKDFKQWKTIKSTK